MCAKKERGGWGAHATGVVVLGGTFNDGEFLAPNALYEAIRATLDANVGGRVHLMLKHGKNMRSLKLQDPNASVYSLFFGSCALGAPR